MRSVSDMQRLRGPTQPPCVLFIVLGVPRNPFYRGGVFHSTLPLTPIYKWGVSHSTPGFLLLKESLFEVFSFVFCIFPYWGGGALPHGKWSSRVIRRVLSQLPRREGASTAISRLLGVEWEL